MTDTRPLGEEEIKQIQGMAEDYKVGNDWWILRAVPNLCKALREANALLVKVWKLTLDDDEPETYLRQHGYIKDQKEADDADREGN